MNVSIIIFPFIYFYFVLNNFISSFGYYCEFEEDESLRDEEEVIITVRILLIRLLYLSNDPTAVYTALNPKETRQETKIHEHKQTHTHITY